MSLAMEFEGDKTYEDGKQYSDDDKLLVKFEVRAVKNEFETEQAGSSDLLRSGLHPHHHAG